MRGEPIVSILQSLSLPALTWRETQRLAETH